MAMKATLKNPIYEKRLLHVIGTLHEGEAFVTLNPSDIFYLTGCTGSNNHLVLFPSGCCILTDGRYVSQINEQCQVPFRLVEIGPTAGFGDAVKDLFLQHTIKMLKFAPEGMSYLNGKDLLAALPDGAQAAQDSPVSALRMVKDEIEVEIIRQNTLLAKGAFLYIQGVIREGISERELAAELEYYCRKQGAETMAFDTIIASGVRSSLPHGKASDKIIGRNDMVQFDFGLMKNHYCSDFSRVIALGSPDAQLMQARQIVEEAVRNVYSKARCGMTGKEIDNLAREIFRKYEVEQYFVHGLGHSLGLDIHENPRLSQSWDKPITQNMVITIEPGIYFPGLGGIRLEDTALMTENGFQDLTECSYEA